MLLETIIIIVLPILLLQLLKLYYVKNSIQQMLFNFINSIILASILWFSFNIVSKGDKDNKNNVKENISIFYFSIILGILCLFLEFEFSFNKCDLKRVFIGILLLLFAFIVLAFSDFSLDSWGKIDFEQLVYHINFPAPAAESKSFIDKWIKNYLIYNVVKSFILALILFIFFPIKFHFDKHISFFEGIKKIDFNIYYDNICLIIFIGLIKQAISKIGIFDVANLRQTTFYENNYIDPSSVHIQFPQNKQNLIIIFLESMETTFASILNGGGYRKSQIPELEEIALDPNNIHFSNSAKLGGPGITSLTTWTVAAQFAVNTGLPLKSKGFKPNFFFTNIVTLFDILSINGYRLFNIVPFPKDDTPTELFRSHSNGVVFDNIDIKIYDKVKKEFLIGKHDWIHDAATLNFSKNIIHKLIQNNSSPICVIIETYDTHMPEGKVCPLCNFSDDSTQFKVVRRCTSRIVNNFVNWFKKQTFFKNTTLFLLGDHLCMGNDVTDDPEGKNAKRTIYNAFINSRANCSYSKRHNRKFTTFDWFPTILASIGCKIYGERLGLGSNLFSNVKTIAEKNIPYNSEIRKDSKFYKERIQGKFFEPKIRLVCKWN